MLRTKSNSEIQSLNLIVLFVCVFLVSFCSFIFNSFLLIFFLQIFCFFLFYGRGHYPSFISPLKYNAYTYTQIIYIKTRGRNGPVLCSFASSFLKRLEGSILLPNVCVRVRLSNLVRTLHCPSTPPQRSDHTRPKLKVGELYVAYCIRPTFEQRVDLQLSSEVAQLTAPGRSFQVVLSRR